MRFRESRNIRQKDKNYLTQHGSVDHTKAPRLTETTYTFLYCRLGVMPQAEVSQSSSVQSERITEVMFSPGNSTSLPLGQQLYKWLIQHFDEGMYILYRLWLFIKHMNCTHRVIILS